MGKPARGLHLPRRAFLRKVGGIAGAIATTSVLSACGAGTTPGQAENAPFLATDTLRIGVLLPQSTRQPLLNTQILDGMRLFFAQSGRPVALVAEQYDSPHDSLLLARDLVASNRVDMITGLVSRNEMSALDDLLRERRTSLIVSDIGANVIHQPHRSEYVLRSSLNYWQANLALGAWAAAHAGKRAVIATSLYESGYDSLYAFHYGFEQGGGAVLDTLVTHKPNGPTDLPALMANIRQLRPELVYAAYSGQEAVDFVRAYAAAGLARHIPLFGPGFLTDEQILPQQGDAALGITTALAWSYALELPENQAFIGAFEAHAGRPADAFAVLGYDTARLISSTLDASDLHGRGWPTRSLGALEFAGPRGHITVDGATGDVAGPLYLREVRRGDGAAYNAVIAELGHSAALNDHAAALRRDMRSGWLHAYLAA
jgi:branched-chain amino acid transport system substrate-binding protein